MPNEEIKSKLKELQEMYLYKRITWEQFSNLSRPLLKEVNDKLKKQSEEKNLPYKKVTLTQLLRTMDFLLK